MCIRIIYSNAMHIRTSSHKFSISMSVLQALYLTNQAHNQVQTWMKVVVLIKYLLQTQFSQKKKKKIRYGGFSQIQSQL